MQRKPLIARVPEIWRRLDYDGQLRRYLEGFDNEFDRIAALAAGILEMGNADGTPDKYLGLLGANLGHEWRTDMSYDWNRGRVRHAIPRASYKGTITRLTDDMVELNAEAISVTDNASKLLVLSKQGRLSEPDSYMVTADFWHDGAYQLQLVDSEAPKLDAAKVDTVLSQTVPAGTIWYLIFSRQLSCVFEQVWTILHGQAIFSGDERQGLLGYGQLIDNYYEDDNTFLSWLPNRQVQKSYYPVVWHFKGNLVDGTLGHSSLGEDTALSFWPTISLTKSHFTAYWHESGSFVSGGLLGDNVLGYDQSLSYPLELPTAHEQYLQKFAIFECGPAIATEAGWSGLSWVFDMGVAIDRYGIHQSFDQVGDFMDIEAQYTMSREYSAIAQAYLTGDSNLPGNIDSIDGNQGTPDIPLTEYQASLQTGTQKTFEEI